MATNPKVDPQLAQKMAAYIAETDELISHLRTERDELKQKVASMDKSASGPESVDSEVVARAVGKLVQAGFLKESHRDQAVTAIAAKPASALLDFVEKLAEQQISRSGATLPKLGHAVGTDRSSGSADKIRESDRLFDQRFGTPSR